MASGPNFNRHRRCWQVSFKDAQGWHRKTVAPAPAHWKPGDPIPKPPVEALAARTHYEAVEKEARARRRDGLPDSLRPFLEEHVARYRKDATRRNVRAVVDQFLAWCENQGIRSFSQVTAQVCGEWLDAVARTHAFSTVKRMRAQLRAAWGRLARRGLIAANPWTNVAPPGKDSPKHRGSWTPDEFERLLAVSRPWLRDVLIIGVNTGLRINALMRLEWRDWRKPQRGQGGFGWIVVRPELDKAGKGYQVPISRELHAVLARRLGMHDPTFVLTGRYGKPLAGKTVTDRAIHAACARAGLPDPSAPNHHMRRSFGRWAVLGHLTGKPVPLYVASRWLGHSSVRMTMEYLDLSEEDSTRFMVPDEA